MFARTAATSKEKKTQQQEERVVNSGTAKISKTKNRKPPSRRRSWARRPSTSEEETSPQNKSRTKKKNKRIGKQQEKRSEIEKEREVEKNKREDAAATSPPKTTTATTTTTTTSTDSNNDLAQSPSKDGSKSSFFGGGSKNQRKIVYTKFNENPSENLTILEEGIPEPRNGNDVVIKVLASTVSFTDCVIRQGICFNLINDIDLPATPGGDIVGNVIKIGTDVRHYKVGDRVAALVRTGGNARYINVTEENLIQLPRSCDSAEAVCMVSTFMTAYQSLRLVTKDNFSLSQKRCLITGGIEPVGQALIQLCKRAGAKEVYATAPLHRHKYIKNVLGAHPLPVQPQDWLPTTKGGMDIVFDGTCHDSLDSPYASLTKDGVLVSVGMSAVLKRGDPRIFGAPVSAYWARLQSHFFSNIKSYEVWESFIDNKEVYKLDLEILFHLLQKKFIKPHIAKRIALSEVPEAQESLEQENTRGEIVCLPWKRDVTRKEQKRQK